MVEVPLERLLDPDVYHEEWWERGGVRRPIAFFTLGEDVIWGATGRILRDFLDLVFPSVGPVPSGSVEAVR